MGPTDESEANFLTAQAQELRLSATLEINELVRKQLDMGKPVVHLGFGEATFPIPKSVRAAHEEASGNTSYLPVAGLWKLRESVARFQTRRLGFTIGPEQVVIAPGSKPLLFALFDIINGDALLPRSSLNSAYDQAISDGSDPRIMLINSPSNPTGQAFSKETLETITSFCKEKKITLISDEIYSDICYAENYATTSCTEDTFNAGQMVLTGGLSKTYSAGGWRVGFAIFPPNRFGTTLQKAILAYASECWSAASAPAQEAAAIAFDTTPEMDTYRSQLTNLHKHCTIRLYEALKNCGLAVAAPKGAFYLYPSFYPYNKQLESLGIYTSRQLSRWLIEQCGVAALPGSVFGEDDEGARGGRYRLRMATSYLYFKDQEERYARGYELLSQALEGEANAAIELPLLEKAIVAIKNAVVKLKNV
ncbi:unnamed protein product [Clonostachys chloroleuca]|uniref:Aminotransferase class I/classII large domain-containing protein n=1 Tax=Clonostachys chloroleuca TaxID=1926264 RepID=A0AA35MCS2_9HYPO|nr:unnamed protein product [Clonostachys chloroleuca]